MAKPKKPPADRIIKSGIISKGHISSKPKRLTGKLIFFPEWCKKCGICTTVCPVDTLKQGDDGTPYLEDEDKCKLCSLCWRICPDFSIVKNPNIDENGHFEDNENE